MSTFGPVESCNDWVEPLEKLYKRQSAQIKQILVDNQDLKNAKDIIPELIKEFLNDQMIPYKNVLMEDESEIYLCKLAVKVHLKGTSYLYTVRYKETFDQKYKDL